AVARRPLDAGTLTGPAVLPGPAAGVPVVRAAHSGGIDDGHPLGVGDVDELPNVGHAVPRLGTAGIAPALDRFEDRLCAVAAEVVVDVDHEQDWTVAEAGTRSISRRGEHLLVTLGQEPIPNGLGHGARPPVRLRRAVPACMGDVEDHPV